MSNEYTNITVVPAKLNDIFNRVSIKETFSKLLMLSNDIGLVTIRNRALAKFLNTNEKTISKNISALKSRGLIEIEKKKSQYGYQTRIIKISGFREVNFLR